MSEKPGDEPLIPVRWGVTKTSETEGVMTFIMKDGTQIQVQLHDFDFVGIARTIMHFYGVDTH